MLKWVYIIEVCLLLLCSNRTHLRCSATPRAVRIITKQNEKSCAVISVAALYSYDSRNGSRNDNHDDVPPSALAFGAIGDPTAQDQSFRLRGAKGARLLISASLADPSWSHANPPEHDAYSNETRMDMVTLTSSDNTEAM
ncbi:hypothetical protein HDV64DRAFT_66217 [Trichoderma sp. TUCIM 5745]